jgi:cardiolipin synthase C
MNLTRIVASLVASTLLLSSAAPLARAAGDWEPNAKGVAQYLAKNEESWFARWLLMRNANQSIVSVYFIIEDDPFGMAFIGLLRQKAAQGVKVQLLIDARGTKKLTRTGLGQDYLQELLNTGNAEIRVFNPLISQGLHLDILNSNHDKILAVDHQYLVAGGRNIAQQYFVDIADLDYAYNDRDVLVDSADVTRQAEVAVYREMLNNYSRPLKADLVNLKSRVAELDLAVTAMEAQMNGQPLSAAMKKAFPALEGFNSMKSFADYAAKRHLKPEGGAVQANLRLLDNTSRVHDAPDFATEESHPDAKLLDKIENRAKLSEITGAVIENIKSSNDVLMFNPYVVVTPRMMEALQDLSLKRKGALTLITNSPSSTDSLPTASFFEGEWRRMDTLLPTLEIFALNRGVGKLHGKVFVFGDNRTIVSSYNLDYISEQSNSEIGVLVDSAEFTKGVRQNCGVIATEKSVHYDVTKNLGPEQIKDSEPDIKRMQRFYSIFSNLRQFL